MSEALAPDPAIDQRIASRVRALRAERGLSLEALAARSGVSRATLSRIENAETSATAAVLGRLAAAFGLSVSRLMHLAEDAFAPLVPAAAQPFWTDPATGWVRRQISPPAAALSGEVVEGCLAPGTRIAYDAPPREGLEHHLVLLAGRLAVTLDGETHALAPGDCLRYRFHGTSAFETPPDAAARYLLFTV